MPVAVQGPLPDIESPDVQHKLWTREECDALVESGLIDPQRYELIEGELIEKVSKTHPHMLAVMLLQRWLNRLFGDLSVLQEPSIHLAPRDTPYSDPEPDIIVLNRPYNRFVNKADPGDIILIIEVSYSSLRIDTTRKAALYARASIQDYWVLDIKRRRILVHRDPTGGRYQSITAFAEDEPVTPLAAPDTSACAKDFLSA